MHNRNNLRKEIWKSSILRRVLLLRPQDAYKKTLDKIDSNERKKWKIHHSMVDFPPQSPN